MLNGILEMQGAADAQGASGAQPLIFALDIGTRSIIGVVGVPEGGLFRVLDIETQEHEKRAMYDGQIEDIEQVARVARSVKEALERRQETEFRHVCVAAAGRALRTVRTMHELQLSPAEPVTARMMFELEMGAVTRAQEQLAQEQPSGKQLHCVGHAVVRYLLDDYPFATLLGHRGNVARVEVIVTFLPGEVVESLYAAMELVGLEVDHLTLEPIAAMNAVIPDELRLLNLALVDIGAGTSDIAISEDGSVSAYTMVTVAGDEITESIIHHFLVDFVEAEAIKHAASEGRESISYCDILGMEATVPLAEVMAAIEPALEELCSTVCNKLLESNGKPPAAVFLVGGGSRAPQLCARIADKLGLEHRKVAVGGNNFMKRVVASDLPLESPEYATPLGIALTAASSSSFEGFFVSVNGKQMRVFRSHTMSVMDVLLLAGYQYQDLMGRNGKSVTYEFNGEKRFLRGGYLIPAQITINGVAASISTPVANGDAIHVLPAVPGKDAVLFAGELEPDPVELRVTFNGTPMTAGRRILVNGIPVRAEDEIHDLDKVEHLDVSTLSALCAQAGLDAQGHTLAVNGVLKLPDYRLQPGDQVVCVGDMPHAAVPAQQATAHASKMVMPAPQEATDTPQEGVQEAAQEVQEGVAQIAPPMPQESVPMPQESAPMPQESAPMPQESAPAPHSATPQMTHSASQVGAPAAQGGYPAPQTATHAAQTSAPQEGVPASQEAVPPPITPSASQTPMPQEEMPTPQMVGHTPHSAPQMTHFVPQMGMPAAQTPAAQVGAPAPQEAVPPPITPPAPQTATPPMPQTATAPQTSPAQPQTAPAPRHIPQTPTPPPAPPHAAPPQALLRVTVNDEPRALPKREQPYQFLDMLNLVDIDPTKPQGNIILRLNGREATYLEEIGEGDLVEIRWDDGEE